MDQPHFENKPGDHDDEHHHDQSRYGRLIKLAALLTLLAFVVFSLSNLSYLFGQRLNFLNQNPGLSNDPLVIKCKPAVVAIETTVLANPLKAGVHQGTGFNVDPRGIIITNQHVVASGKNITVTFSDGRRFMTREYETISGQDLAIIRLNRSNLPYISLDSDFSVAAGEFVTIIGNPLGFQKIAQRGAVVSGYSANASRSPAFEIDLSINPGNSGSPVINEQGRVIGVIFASLSRTENGSKVSRGLAVSTRDLLDLLKD